VAQRYAVTIYPIAIGDAQTAGQDELDVKTLQRVAEISGGRFYHALDRQQLSTIYQRIAELEPQVFDAQSYRPRWDKHHLPMLLVTVLMMFFLLLTFYQTRPVGGRAQDRANDD